MPLGNVARQRLKLQLRPIVEEYLSEHPGLAREYKKDTEELLEALRTEAGKPAEAATVETEAEKPPEVAKAEAEATKPPEEAKKAGETTEGALSELKIPELKIPDLPELPTGALEEIMQEAEAASEGVSELVKQKAEIKEATEYAVDDASDDQLIEQALREGANAATEAIIDKVDPEQYMEVATEKAESIDIDPEEALKKLASGELSEEEEKALVGSVSLETGLDDASEVAELV